MLTRFSCIYNAEVCCHWETCFLNKTCCRMKPKELPLNLFTPRPFKCCNRGCWVEGGEGRGKNKRESARVSGRVGEARLKIPVSLKLTFCVRSAIE